MIRCFVFISILFSAALCLGKEEPEPSPRPSSDKNNSVQNPVQDLIHQLPSSELQQALNDLKSNYIDPNALKNPEIDESAIESLVDRLGPGARMETKEESEAAPEARPFRTDLLSSQFGYIRIGGLKQDDLAQLDNALNDLRLHDRAGIILDLRTMPPVNDYSLAAAILSRFVQKGQLLFKLRPTQEDLEKSFNSSDDPIYSGPVAVLVTRTNAGAAEVIAGVLRVKTRALVIGQKTSGRAVEYKQYAIGTRLILLVAVSQVQIPGLAPIFPRGLVPDTPVVFADGSEEKVLSLGDTNGVQELVQDEDRPRTNEAALVAGKNPDLDAFESDQMALKRDRSQAKDLVIQRAIDFLTAITVYRAK
jgi:hypothetical protein